MTGFEPRTSGIESDRSTNWATTTFLRMQKMQGVRKLSIPLCKRMQITQVWKSLYSIIYLQLVSILTEINYAKQESCFVRTKQKENYWIKNQSNWLKLGNTSPSG